MATVYVVTAGEYSSYGIEGVFSIKELADEYCAKHNASCKYAYGNKARVEEYNLDCLKGVEILECWGVAIQLGTGIMRQVAKQSRLVDPAENGNLHDLKPQNWIYVYSNESQEHANKLAVEERQRWLRERRCNEVPVS